MRDDATIPVSGDDGVPVLLLSRANGAPTEQVTHIRTLTDSLSCGAVVLLGVSGSGKTASLHLLLEDVFGILLLRGAREPDVADLMDAVRQDDPAGPSPKRVALLWIASRLIIMCTALEKRIVSTPKEWLRVQLRRDFGAIAQRAFAHVRASKLVANTAGARTLVHAVCKRIFDAVGKMGSPERKLVDLRIVFAIDECQTLLEADIARRFGSPPTLALGKPDTVFGLLSNVFANDVGNSGCVLGVFSGTSVAANLVARAPSGASKGATTEPCDVKTVAYKLQDDPR